MNGFGFNCCVNVLIIFTMMHVITSHVIHTHKQRYTTPRTHKETDNFEDDHKTLDTKVMLNIPVLQFDIESLNRMKKRSVPRSPTLQDGWEDCACLTQIEKKLLSTNQIKDKHEENDYKGFLRKESNTPYIYTVKCGRSVVGKPCHSVKNTQTNPMICSQDYTLMAFYAVNGSIADSSNKPNFTLKVPSGCSCRTI